MFDVPNTDQNADPRKIDAGLSGVAQNVEEGTQYLGPLRFGIGQLLIATAVAAVLLALFRAMGIVGAALAFAFAFAFTLGIYPYWQPSRPRQAAMFDFVWGMVMPLVCFVFDPFVFKQDEALLNGADILGTNLLATQIYNLSFVVYGWLGWQIVAMGVVLAAGRIRGPWAGILTGTLFLGAGFAAVIGVLLIPLATMGLLMIIGVLRYTPLFTAYAYSRRYKQVSHQSLTDLPGTLSITWGIVGAILALTIPAVVGMTLLAAVRGSQALTRLF